MGNSETTFFELDIDKDYFKDKLLKIFLQKEYVKEVEAAIPVMNIPLSRTGIFKLFLKPNKYVAVIRDVANWEYLYKEFEVEPDYDEEIDALTTINNRKTYLKKIFDVDQKARKDIDSVQSKYGYESKEYREQFQLFIKTDSINLVKIDQYLAKYGYPAKSVYDEIPSMTPGLVIHHNSSGEAREKFFPILYKAWQNKDIKDNSFLLYLNRSYRIKFGKPFNRPSGIVDSEEIDELIKELGFKKE